jgi:hypothetical protein
MTTGKKPKAQKKAAQRKTKSRARPPFDGETTIYSHELPSAAPAEIVHVVPNERHWQHRHHREREKHWADLKERMERRFVDLGRGETLYQKFKEKK